MPLERGKCDSSSHPFTSRATPAAIGDQTEQHNLPIESKKYGQESVKPILIGSRARRIN